MDNLCDRIADELELGGNPTGLLDKWHKHAGRQYARDEFTTYWKSTSKEEFIHGALNKSPEYCHDLTYHEVDAILLAVMTAEVPENQTHYFLDWLEEQFPNANMSDLIYWPDEWFGNSSLFRDENGAFKSNAELDSHQIICYAMKKSGRYLDGRPVNVELPFPMPTQM